MTAAQLWPQGHQNHLITIGASDSCRPCPVHRLRCRLRTSGCCPWRAVTPQQSLGGSGACLPPAQTEPSWRLQDTTLNGQRMGLVTTWGAGISGTCHPVLRTHGHHR